MICLRKMAQKYFLPFHDLLLNVILVTTSTTTATLLEIFHKLSPSEKSGKVEQLNPSENVAQIRLEMAKASDQD